MKIPGQIFQKMINFDSPIFRGYYIVWAKPVENQAIHSCMIPADIKVSYWQGEKWLGSNPVMAWMGPLPVLSMDELEIKKDPQDLGICIFCKGVLDDKGGVKKILKDTYTYNAFSAECMTGETENDALLMIWSNKSKPEIYKVWNTDVNKWRKYNKNKKSLSIKRGAKSKNKGVNRGNKKDLKKNRYFVCSIKDKALFPNKFGGWKNLGAACASIIGSKITKYVWDEDLPIIQSSKTGYSKLSTTQSKIIEKKMLTIRSKKGNK